MYIKAGFIGLSIIFSLIITINAQDIINLHNDYANIEIDILDREDLPQYLTQLKEELKIAKQQNDTFQIAEKNLFLGRIYFLLNSVEISMGYSTEALNYFYKTQDTVYQIHSLRLLSSLYGQINENAISLEYVWKALELSELIKNIDFIQGSYINISGRYFQLGNKDESLKYLYKAINIQRETENKALNTYMYNNLGVFYFETNIDSSYFYFKKSLSCIENEETSIQIASTYSNLADAAYEKELYPEALNYALIALDFYKKNEIAGSIYNGYVILINSLIKLKRYDEAIKYMTESLGVREDIYNQRKSDEAAKLKIIYEVNELEAKNTILSKENDLQEEKLSKTKLILYFAITFIIFTILVIFFYIIQNSKLKKSYKKIVEESVKAIQAENENDDLKKKLNGNKIITKNSDNEMETENEDSKFFKRIINLLETKKLYVNSDFSLEILSKELNKNRVYISQTINKIGNKSFAALINEYRVVEAKKQLCSKNIELLTIEAIGSNSGFNSRSTFFRVFKDQTGVTPNFFMKNAEVID